MFVLPSYTTVFSVGVSIYIGSTTSTPYIIEKGISPVVVQLIVLYAHKTFRSSSTHFLFKSSSLLFRVYFKILLMASTWRLDCGCIGAEKSFWMPKLSQNLCVVVLLNYFPLSDTIECGTLNQHTMLFHIKLVQVASVVEVRAFVSAHLV